jgi:ATP phosphoribosyltransferase regulatory subunit
VQIAGCQNRQGPQILSSFIGLPWNENIMTSNSLLPEGLRDRLPPQAQALSQVNRALLDVMARHGYARVAPPLAEFRETLDGQGDDAVGSSGGVEGRDLLRFTDPVSQRTLAIRPDITTQIGRIATTRMAQALRPLRLCYSGQVVKLRASQLRPDREMLQIGAELVGHDSVAAAQEILLLAVESLASAGIGGITIDITMPDLVTVLSERAMPLPPALVPQVRDRLDAKDAGGLMALGPDAAAYLPLIDATGDFDVAAQRLRSVPGGADLAERILRLEALAAALKGAARVTLDPTERHGFEYQSWFGFSIFVAGFAGAIGRGGSYAIRHSDGRMEPATGFSIYPDPVIDAGLSQIADAGTVQRIFLPLGHDRAVAGRLRSDGWVTVGQMGQEDTPGGLGCTHRLDGDAILPV